jgi:hypothetical protein
VLVRTHSSFHSTALGAISISVGPDSALALVENTEPASGKPLDTMSTQIEKLVQYNARLLFKTHSTRERFKFIFNANVYLVPKDEERPIEDLRRWEFGIGTMSSEDRKRTRFWKCHSYDMYCIPTEVANKLDHPTAVRLGTPDDSRPPSYEAVSKTPRGSEREAGREAALPLT